MKIKDIKNLISVYGGESTLNQILEKKLSQKPYKCPKCNGIGTNSIRYNAYPSGLPDSGWVERWEYKDVECDLCNGEGCTVKEYKPKMVQQGWE